MLDAGSEGAAVQAALTAAGADVRRLVPDSGPGIEAALRAETGAPLHVVQPAGEHTDPDSALEHGFHTARAFLQEWQRQRARRAALPLRAPGTGRLARPPGHGRVRPLGAGRASGGRLRGAGRGGRSARGRGGRRNSAPRASPRCGSPRRAAAGAPGGRSRCRPRTPRRSPVLVPM
ncbi:hypothetical protein IHE61_04190 [Streptomyces sp. GKU 257-1]|nr:hypothetical protein [Streptomyces sp. GKU 257-1]